MHVYRKKESYLCHHGIKGQHWGVKNGPPYPLDIKVSRQIKAGKNEDRHTGKHTGRSHSFASLGSVYVRTNEDIAKESWEDFYKKPEEYKKQFRDNDAFLREVNDTGDGYKNAVERDEIKKLLEGNLRRDVSSYYDKDYKRWERKDRNTIDQDEEEDIRKYGFIDSMRGHTQIENINSYHREMTPTDPGYRNNCSKCSDLVELALRGINTANFGAGRSNYGMLSSANEYHWDGAISYKEKSYDSIENRIKKFGNKGSGVISIRRADGSGHAMHFSTCLDENTGQRRIEVQDGQTGKIYRHLKQALDAEGHDPNQFCHITRLDTATPNIDHMLEDSVIVMREGNQGVSYDENKVWTGNNSSMSKRVTAESNLKKEEESYRSSYRTSGRNFRYRG